ncbi:MAG: hypothetical protein U9Q81_17405 [Pseudomonadota bacterium]|nr:hypothetical protein [Pseudomonadota bacterium]
MEATFYVAARPVAGLADFAFFRWWRISRGTDPVSGQDDVNQPEAVRVQCVVKRFPVTLYECLSKCKAIVEVIDGLLRTDRPVFPRALALRNIFWRRYGAEAGLA